MIGGDGILEENSTEIRYFAYGSNLNLDDLHRYCERVGRGQASFRRLACAYLPDRELVFHYRSPTRGGGALDTRPRRGSVVEGVLFEVNEAGWEALDQKEGVASGRYRRIEVVVLTKDGRESPATTYEVCEAFRQGFVEPRGDYVAIVARGLDSHGLSDEALRCAAAGRPPPATLRGVFVYGTLMRGQSRWPILERHRVVSVAAAEVVAGLLHLGAYPGIVPDPSGSAITRGELVELERLVEAIEVLDEVEDFQGYGASFSLYRRSVIEAQTDEGVALCWTYVYTGSALGASPIPSGDWRDVS